MGVCHQYQRNRFGIQMGSSKASVVEHITLSEPDVTFHVRSRAYASHSCDC